MSHATPTSPASVDALSAASAAVLPLPVSALSCFQRLMAYEGWAVDLGRLCVDSAYAQDCLATAHTSSLEDLRRAALQLFEAFGRNTAPARMH